MHRLGQDRIRTLLLRGSVFLLGAAMLGCAQVEGASPTSARVPPGPHESSAASAGAEGLEELTYASSSPAPSSGCYRPPSPVAPPEGVTVTLSLSTTRVSPDEPLIMSLQVRNGGSAPVGYWTSAERFDLWVEGPTGLVWMLNQSAVAQGETLLGVLRRETLTPEEVLQERGTWSQRDCLNSKVALPRGWYTARGVWIAYQDLEKVPEEGWWSNSVEFEIR